ncbi:MAG TPA: lipoprotein-releasing ABC transporter permease subunit [Gammaproteobacteria bacterium]|nr:lipoprotein-releasing ABC transporter permease subunit [Gammaproteobacteria bacterium]
MRQPYELSIAVRYLRTRSAHSFISFISAVSMIGIALAVAVLIVVLSVMNGFENELQQRILGMVSDAQIIGYPGRFTDWREARERVLDRDDVEAVAPYVEGLAMAVAGEALAGVTVRGVEPTLETTVSTIDEVMTSGDFGSLTPGSFNVVIGAQLAKLLGVGIGDEVGVWLAEGRMTLAGFLPRHRTFTVSGIFDAGMYEYDRGLVFVSFDDAAKLFGTDGEATGLRLAIPDLYNASDVAKQAAQQLIEEGFAQKYQYDNWTSVHYTFFRSIQLQKTMLFVILSLVVAVAAFNIVSTLMMVVRDKRGDIAILRSVGTTQGSVMAMFASQGTLIGFIGTGLGVLLALLFCWQIGNIVDLLQWLFGVDLLSAEVYYLDTLPAQVRPLEVLQIGGLALALAVAATFYPALAAARQPPAEALRYE